MQKIQNLCENYGTFIWLRCFISEKTYQRSEFLFSGIIDNGTPITLVKNGKDSVDLFIRREIEKALEYDMADTFLIGTDDRGPTYQETVKKIGDCNKSFKFLTVQTEFPRILNEDDAGQTGAPSANSRESAIKNCVRALMRNNFPKTNAPQEQFLKEIAVILKRRIADSNPPTFFQLTAMIWNDLDGKTRESFDALDCQYAIGALHSIADVLISVKKGHRNSNGKKVHLYYLNQSNPLFSALTA
jgi:hypothetical protein